MTQEVVDPFAAPSGDPFAQPASGGGTFPKAGELIGELVMLSPTKIEQQQKYRAPAGEMQDRLTATTVVLTGERAGQSYDEMWWTNSSIVKAGRAAMSKGQRMILGRLRRFPINEDVKAGKFKAGDWEGVEAALKTWAADPLKVEKPSFAICLDQYTEEDAAVAREYLKQGAKTLSPV